MDRSALSAFVTTAVSPATGAGRVSHALRAHLAGRKDVVAAVINRDSGWLELRPLDMDAGAGGAGLESGVEAIAKGFRKAGKSVFTLSFKGRIPPFRKSFLETQNLACLKVPRAGIFAFDIFYLTHPDSWADRALARLLYRGLADYPFILTCSEYSRGEISEHMRIRPERIQVVPLDCDRAIFSPRTVAAAEKAAWMRDHGLPADRRLLVHVSSGDKRKNLPGILRALRLAVEKHPDAVLIKAGKVLHGANHQALLASLAAMGLKDRVFFLEGLSDRDLASLYNAADCFVFPSLAEGFGLPVLEAQACGCPVVTSNTTSLKEIAGPLCLAVDPGDDNAIAGAIDAILRDPAFKTRNAEVNQAWLRRFSYEPARRLVAEWLTS